MAALTLDDLLPHLNREAGTDAGELQSVLDAAVSFVEALCGHISDRPAATFKVATGEYGQLLLPVVRIGDVTAVVDPDGEPVVLVEVEVDAANGILTVPRRRGGTWSVTCTYGVAGPEALRLAALIMAGHMWGTQRMPQPGRIGLNRDEQPAGMSAGYAVPNRVSDLMKPFLLT